MSGKSPTYGSDEVAYQLRGTPRDERPELIIQTYPTFPEARDGAYRASPFYKSVRVLHVATKVRVTEVFKRSYNGGVAVHVEE